MTGFLSGEPKIRDAYESGKDLYAIIAQSAFHNEYWENLEFYPEGYEIEIDGKKIVCGKKTHLNKAGKERRSTGKVLNLAATYGMSGPTAGARLGYTGKEAREKGQELLDKFFEGFSYVKRAIDQSKDFLKKNGYVEDFLGRRRRLTDINLEPYTVEYTDKDKLVAETFNPFLNCKDRVLINDPITIWQQIVLGYCILSNAYHIKNIDATHPWIVKSEMSMQAFDRLSKIARLPSLLNVGYSDPNAKVDNFRNKSNKAKILADMQEVQNILKFNIYRKQEVPENEDFKALVAKYIDRYGYGVPTDIPDTSIKLSAWTGKIAQAGRQCFNARIQGSAASLTKLAMIDIANDEIMKKCKAQLIIPVHDELLVECPEYYSDIVEKRLPEIMINAAIRGGDDMPQSCDPYNVTRWYASEEAASLLDEEKKLEKSGMPKEEAFKKVVEEHPEFPEKAILDVLHGTTDELIF